MNRFTLNQDIEIFSVIGITNPVIISRILNDGYLKYPENDDWFFEDAKHLTIKDFHLFGESNRIKAFGCRFPDDFDDPNIGVEDAKTLFREQIHKEFEFDVNEDFIEFNHIIWKEEVV